MRHVLRRRRSSENHSRRSALTLVEVIVVLAILAVLSLVALPVIFRPVARGCRVNVCGANLKGIGVSMMIYANDNAGSWAIPGFDESAVAPIDYTVPVGGGEGNAWSPNRTQPSMSGPGGARQLSTTRAFWMMVRSGDIPVRQFICPKSGDTPDPTANIDLYYDFTGYSNISYGYHVPFGPPETRPREGRDNRLALAADKGPYVDAAVATPSLGLNLNTSPTKDWFPFNSRNHASERESGQNVLFADGHVNFKRAPLAGINYDNIYTIAVDGENSGCRTTGETPWMRSAPPLVTTDPETGERTSTDSVIFP